MSNIFLLKSVCLLDLVHGVKNSFRFFDWCKLRNELQMINCRRSLLRSSFESDNRDARHPEPLSEARRTEGWEEGKLSYSAKIGSGCNLEHSWARRWDQADRVATTNAVFSQRYYMLNNDYILYLSSRVWIAFMR